MNSVGFSRAGDWISTAGEDMVVKVNAYKFSLLILSLRYGIGGQERSSWTSTQEGEAFMRLSCDLNTKLYKLSP